MKRCNPNAKMIECSRAIAEAVKLCKPDVIAAYPITPQTHIVEDLAKMIANGDLNSEYLRVESEHSALSACIGAQATGSRTFTATNSQGLALMSEMLYVASGMRLPIVMAISNRALSSPINIWNDHSDTMSVRDSGWIQLHCESSQEAFDTIIQAYKIAEEINLPVMVCVDGFTLSHLWEPVEMINEDQIKTFLPPYCPKFKLETENPITLGPIGYPFCYQGFKEKQHKAMLDSSQIIKKINKEFLDRFGRGYGDGLIELYRMDDAKKAIVIMGSACGTAREVIDKLREKKEKVGMIKIKSFRPLPVNELKKACERIRGLAIIDRAISLGNNAPLYTELKAVLPENIKINSFITGLGGKDVTMQILEEAIKKIGQKKEVEFL